ncbi:4Fe-4S dicluster domain-containing protein [Pseudomonas resinovorans]|uniref:4Fe-4S dicluster domain-containing protein n=1 Tax=Metapseudomonas resinovorans TaxID=53412 RepID=UPI00237F04FB|nr:4Fe-4S dicluster domain-containing protein [Pseudomonas resinovorans]MDE3738913.1 4Fe-4S dicluster domain-containing protein [Pseudomonas resinovorans]
MDLTIIDKRRARNTMGVYRLEHPEKLRSHLANGRRLFEVRPDEGEMWRWQQVDAADVQPFKAPLDPPVDTPRRFLFAERELLFRFEGGNFYSALPEPAPQVLFGVHSCDLQAIAYLDLVFADDPHYQARRRALLLVGLDCHHSCNAGFCSTLSSGPSVRQSMADLVLLPLERRGYLLLVTSTAGANALEGLDLDPAEMPWQDERARNTAQVSAAQGSVDDIASGIAAINAGLVAADTWEAIALDFLGTEDCASLCPTCACFTVDLQSVGDGQSSIGERSWDSCLSADFQLEAQGHNPSSSAGQRTHHFWLHKFGNAFRKRYGSYGCVGCGRCERAPRKGIGAKEALRRVARP